MGVYGPSSHTEILAYFIFNDLWKVILSPTKKFLFSDCFYNSFSVGSKWTQETTVQMAVSRVPELHTQTWYNVQRKQSSQLCYSVIIAWKNQSEKENICIPEWCNFCLSLSIRLSCCNLVAYYLKYRQLGFFMAFRSVNRLLRTSCPEHKLLFSTGTD